jgi:hypothetical protein
VSHMKGEVVSVRFDLRCVIRTTGGKTDVTYPRMTTINQVRELLSNLESELGQQEK